MTHPVRGSVDISRGLERFQPRLGSGGGRLIPIRPRQSHIALSISPCAAFREEPPQDLLIPT